MIFIRTISRAILTVLLAAAFLVMSVAGGLHELTHFARRARALDAYAAATSMGSAAHGRIDHGKPAQSRSDEGDFCFFCTFGSSVTFSFATITFEPGTVTLPPHPAPPAPDLAPRTITLPSLRAPPSLA